MNGLSRILGSILAANSSRDCNEDEIRYGAEVFLGALLQILLLVLVGWWLGMLAELVVTLFAFSVYRRYAGGSHSSAYYRCTIIGLITFPILAYSCRFIDYRFFWIYFISIAIFTLIIIYWKAPMDTEVKPINDPGQRRGLRIRAFVIVILLLAASIFAHMLGRDLVAAAILLGIGWQTITMTHIGVSYTRFWDIALSNWWVNKTGKEEL